MAQNDIFTQLHQLGKGACFPKLLDSVQTLSLHPPLSVDVGVSQGAVSDWRHKVHGDVGESTRVQVHGQALKQIVRHTGRVARYQHTPSMLQCQH